MADLFDERDVEADAEWWKDPDNPWRLNRKVLREPDGYEAVEHATLMSRLHLLQNILMLREARGLLPHQNAEFILEIDSTLAQLEEFYSSLKKEENE